MIIIYKVIQVIIIILFAFFVSDLRKKNQTTELLNHNLLLFMKLIYIVPLVIFLYSVVKVSNILWSDVFGLLLTLFGLFIVIIAKFSLGNNHSWTGYGTFPDAFCAKGIYSVVRHPMYFGIFLCIGGMWFHVVGHLGWLLIAINLISSLFIIYVLASSSKKEELHLKNLFGESYERYKQSVPPVNLFNKG